MSHLNIYADESGNVNTHKDSNHYGIGYFAIKASVEKSFVKELKDSGLDKIHMKDLNNEQKKEALTGFIEVAKRYPCFGGAWFQLDAESALKINMVEMEKVAEKPEFQDFKEAIGKGDKRIEGLKKVCRLMEIYSAISRFPFVHEYKSCYQGQFKTSNVHIGVIGDEKKFIEKIQIFLDEILEQGSASHEKFVKMGHLSNYDKIVLDFDLKNDNPLLGAADIFAYLGHYKATNDYRFEAFKKIAQPVLGRIKNFEALLLVNGAGS